MSGYAGTINGRKFVVVRIVSTNWYATFCDSNRDMPVRADAFARTMVVTPYNGKYARWQCDCGWKTNRRTMETAQTEWARHLETKHAGTR